MMTPQEERMAVMERIIEKNRIADEKYEREMAENNEAAEMEGYDREMEKENAEYEHEEENEMNCIESPEELQELLSEEYGDLWNHAPTRQKMVDEAELAIAAGERVDDMRTYTKIAEKYRERKKQLESGEIDERAIEREDTMNQLAAQRHRQMLIDNQYANAGAEEPVTPEQARERFAMDNPDFTGEELRDAAKSVDETHKKQFVQRGYASNEYEVYREVGEDAKRPDAF